MNVSRTLFILVAFIALISVEKSQATLLTLGEKIGVRDNFEYLGLTVLETREDGTKWEWLNLTVTNGISYASLITDLSDDALLNNSGDVLVGNNGALNDVDNLDDNLRGGWSTVSTLEVTDLLNSFLGLNLQGGENYEYDSNVDIVEEFILGFGDTWHEGFLDDLQVHRDDNNTQLPNIGFSVGMTSEFIVLHDVTTTSTVWIVDGQYVYSRRDRHDDYIDQTRSEIFGDLAYRVGTWLNRPVVVNSPSTIGLFSLVLIYLSTRRFVGVNQLEKLMHLRLKLYE